MIFQVHPTSALRGAVQLPASKSYSIRAFIIAACGGNSQVFYPSDCDDAQVAINVARQLGSRITHSKSDIWKVAAKSVPAQLNKIHVGESGTVLRFVLPLLALQGQKALVAGEGTLRGRPNLFLTKTLRSMGVDIRGTGKEESIPVRMTGGILQAGKFEIEGSLSSQFISALLIACPQLDRPTEVIVKGKLVSADYITMTIQVLAESGISVRPKGTRRFFIEGNQQFKGLKNFMVPSDYGLAAFLMAAALLNNSDVTLKGIFRDKFIQADGHILTLLNRMGGQFKKTANAIRIKGPSVLKGGSFSLKDCPDLVPIMAVLALFARGKTRLYNIGHARAKESDRISDLINELRKVGAHIEEKSEEMIISPKYQYISDVLLNPHHDHRLAMAFAVLGTKVGVRVADIGCTAKSYPGFVRDFKAIGVKSRNI